MFFFYLVVNNRFQVFTISRCQKKKRLFFKDRDCHITIVWTYNFTTVHCPKRKGNFGGPLGPSKSNGGGSDPQKMPLSRSRV